MEMFWIGRVSNKISSSALLSSPEQLDRQKQALLTFGSTYLQPPFNIDKHSFERAHHSAVGPSQLGCEITN